MMDLSHTGFGTTSTGLAKACVQAHYADIARATPGTVADALAARMAPNALWRGMRPFYEQTGPQAVAQAFWAPFLTAFSYVQRREDIFFAGANSVGQGTWTVSMGHLMGLFDAPFIGIKPTGKIAMLRYAEFNLVEDGRILETALFVDLLHLMAQAGVVPLPEQTAAQMIQPGPRTHDGLLYTDQDPAEGPKTQALIDAMIGAINHANAAAHPPTPQEELSAHWHPDMCWWGPTGIGSTYTIDRYIAQHQAPFRTKTKDREFYGHIARVAEGNYGGFFGWPNLSIIPVGNYLGVPASGMRAPMRVVDIYRREGDKLAENWIFIDILHFLSEQGMDLLAALDR
ncbi:MAG: ester cyclase [Pseudomonadota bacterium]